MDCSQTLTSHILNPTMYQETLEDTVEHTFENIAEKLAAAEPPKGSCQGWGNIVAAMKSDSPPRSKAASKEFNSPPRSSTHRQGGATAKELPKRSCQGRGASEGSPNCQGGVTATEPPKGSCQGRGTPEEPPNGRETTHKKPRPGGTRGDKLLKPFDSVTFTPDLGEIVTSARAQLAPNPIRPRCDARQQHGNSQA